MLGSLQSHLDATDISDLAARYRAAYPDSELFDPVNLPEPDVAKIEAFITKYLEYPEAGATENGWSFRERLTAFSIAATFKDCSVMVRLPLAKSSGAWQLASNPTVKIVDTDLKPLSSLRKWYDLDEKLWRRWLEYPPQSADVETVKGDPGVVSPLGSAIRPAAFTSSSGLEGSSVRAMFVPTPDRSAPGTPMEPQVEKLADFPDMAKQTTTKPKAAEIALAPIIVPTVAPPRTTGESTTEEAPTIVEPTTPVRLSTHAKRGSEAVSLADALAITPSASHFALAERAPTEADEDVVRPLQELPVEQNSPLAGNEPFRDLISDKTLPAIIESSPSTQEDLSVAPEAQDHQGLHPTVVDTMPVTEAIPEPAESTSGSPVMERTARSLAPSPSPHPDATDYPVARNAVLDDAPAHESHLVVPHTEVLITDPISHSGPIESSRDIETDDPVLEDQGPSKVVAPLETSASHDDRPAEETETGHSGILGMAGTAAAVSAAALVGALGAVAGVTAAAVDVTSPTKSTFDREANESAADEQVGQEHAPTSHSHEISSGADELLPSHKQEPLHSVEADAETTTVDAVTSPAEPTSHRETIVEAPIDGARSDGAEQPEAHPDHVNPSSNVDEIEHSQTMPGGSEVLLEDVSGTVPSGKRVRLITVNQAPVAAVAADPLDEFKAEVVPPVTESTAADLPRSIPTDIDLLVTPHAPPPAQDIMPVHPQADAGAATIEDMAAVEHEQVPESEVVVQNPVPAAAEIEVQAPSLSRLDDDNAGAPHAASEAIRGGGEDAIGEDRPRSVSNTSTRVRSSVAARVAAFEGMAEPVERSISRRSNTPVQAHGELDPVPAQEMEHQSNATVEPPSGLPSTIVQHADEQNVQDTFLESTAEPSTEFQADGSVNEPDTVSSKAVKRSTFGQVEEGTAINLAQMHDDPDHETGLPMDESTEPVDHMEPARDALDKHLEQPSEAPATEHVEPEIGSVDYHGEEEEVEAPHHDVMPVVVPFLPPTVGPASDGTREMGIPPGSSSAHFDVEAIPANEGDSERLPRDASQTDHNGAFRPCVRVHIHADSSVVAKPELATPVEAAVSSHSEAGPVDAGAHMNPAEQHTEEVADTVIPTHAQGKRGATSRNILLTLSD